MVRPRESVAFYLSAPHACSYLEGQEARTLFADPAAPVDTRLYAQLAAHGFRRSGSLVYRPQCARCDACIPARVPVHSFHPSRTQRRTWKRNQDLEIRAVPPHFQDEHFAMYRRYMRYRHPGGGMDTGDPAKYMDFLTSPWVDTVFYEFRTQASLAAVAVVDRLEDALSAVYTFFDPRQASRSLGVYAVLRQIHEADQAGLSWVYLGYWIQACPKMAYKGQYRPLQILRDGAWSTVS